MSSVRTNPADRLTVGLTEAQMVTKLHSRFLAIVRLAGVDAAETPSPSSDITWQDLDPNSPFRAEHLAANTLANAKFAAAGTGRELVAENYATGAFGNVQTAAGVLGQRACGLRNVAGHIRAAQTHKVKQVVYRGLAQVTLNGTAPGPAESHKAQLVGFSLLADEYNMVYAAPSPYLTHLRPQVPQDVARFTTSGGAEAVVKAQLDLTEANWGWTEFAFYLVQYERAGGVWTKANTEATTKTYDVEWYVTLDSAA